ncbi:hypothetical protein BGX31_004143 [Mortierella sp. GBA43]|nr:hypothetical protein BGX31_004143 [Mortierella sp. GBA43]
MLRPPSSLSAASTDSAITSPSLSAQRTMYSSPRTIPRGQSNQIPAPSAGATTISALRKAPTAIATPPSASATTAAAKSVSPPSTKDHSTNDVSSVSSGTVSSSVNGIGPAPTSPNIAATSTTASAAPNTPSGSKTENVTVTVRIRPFSNSELKVAGGLMDVWGVSDEGDKIGYTDDYLVNARRVPVEYIYDHALTGSDNEEIYNSSVKNLVKSAMEGYNGTVFAYGQTSSGKTYSGTDSHPGITPRAVEDIFKYIRENPNREFLLRVSFLEIYNESIRDLLSPESNDLRIHEDRRRGIYVSPLKEEIVTTPSQVMRIIERGNNQRHVSSTDFNAHSSRSHSIFQIVIESRDRMPAGGGSVSPTAKKPMIAGSKVATATAVCVSQLNLIDLAGSEKAVSNEERRKEGAFINKSLLTLGTVISKLTEEKGAHIPYRDSKLTRILQSSLNGNARVSVICTISPSVINVEESHNTLKFAARVKKVVTKAQTNQVMDDKALLEKYRREISELKAQLTTTGSGAGGDAEDPEKTAELSTLLEKERMKHEEEMLEMNMVRGALKERIEHLTKLILTSQSINTKAPGFDVPAARSTVETSSDGTVLEFPKEIESRLAMKDAIAKETQLELESEQEKAKMLRMALEKLANGENIDIQETLTKADKQAPLREKRLHQKRASIMSLQEVVGGSANGVNGHGPAAGADQGFAKGSPRQDDELADTPWNREELLQLRQVKRELEIIVVEQDKKLENMMAFEYSEEFQNMVFEMEQQREKIMALEEEREMFRRTIRDLEFKVQSTPSTPTHSTSSSSSLAAATARIKELEAMVQKEQQLKLKEQQQRLKDHNLHMGRIMSMEAELTEAKTALRVHNLAVY